MARTQGAALDRKKLMGDPILVTTIVVLITFLTLFILYPLAILLVDSFVGDGGFGYDPIFFVPSLRKTFAQLTAEEKNAISHRGNALRSFAAELKTYLENH